ncbi:hypothetical protein Pcinc_023576 [Petrolisthes cinctipes]|uniref:Cilia- and flagella-associated protein 97 n=1 Tax=Petrolisthes cinctipes TaxID=88211 RepID=A0AAE1KFL5_PETCI|nr:hypothetical protein Pcinc_023576 [Petrolisthes cinctipes]
MSVIYPNQDPTAFNETQQLTDFNDHLCMMAHKIGENVTLYEPDIISSEVKLSFYQEDDSVVDRTKKGCVSGDKSDNTNTTMVSGPSVTLGSSSTSSSSLTTTNTPLVLPPSATCLEDSRYRCCGVEVTSCSNGSGGRCLGEGHKGEEEVWRRDSDGEGVSRNPNTAGMVGGGSSSSFEAQQQQQQQQHQQIDFDHQQSAPQACAVMEHVDHHHNHIHHHLNPYSSDEWDESDLSDTDGDHSDSSDDDDPKSQVDRLIDQVTLVYLDGENSNLSSESESSDDSDYDVSDSDSDITDVSPLISATASPLGLSPVLPRRALGTSPLALHDNRDLSTFDYPSVNGSGYPPHTHPGHPINGLGHHGSSGDNSTDMSGLLKAVVELEKKKQQRRKQGGHRTRSESSYHHQHHHQQHHHNNTHNNHHQHYNDRLTTTTNTTESSSRDDNRLNGTTTTTTTNNHHHRSSPISIHPIDASPHHRHLRRPSNNHHQRRKNMSFTNEEVRRIDRDNQILLQKIVTAHSRSNNRSQAHHHASNNRSVHRPANATVSRRREDERIRRDNMILLRKIQEAKPSREVASFRSPRHRASPGLRPPSSLPPPTPGSCGALARSGHAATPTPRKETAL